MIIDTAAPRSVDPEAVRRWLAGQRVFISSAMADTSDERRAVAEAVRDAGAVAAWFEEFGRDADAEEAYLTEVDASTIYVGIANGIYGRLNPPGFSATEIEFERARAKGKRVTCFVAAAVSAREGHLARFIDRVRYFVTTENYADPADLARRVTRRLSQLAAEALSPWVKLGELVFRADHIEDSGSAIGVRSKVSDTIAEELEAARDQRHRRSRHRFVHGNRVVDASITNLRRTTTAGVSEFAIELDCEPAATARTRVATSQHSASDLVEQGVRELFLAEKAPGKSTLGFLTDTGINADDLRQAFDQPNETAEAIARLVVAEGMIGSGAASRIVQLALGPRLRDRRPFELAWLEPTEYSNVAPRRRTVAGEWVRA